MTRREMIGMSGVGVVALAVAGRVIWAGRGTARPDRSYPVHRSDDQWRTMLSPSSYRVLRKGGTEAPFSSPLLNEHRQGLFACAGCDQKLFESRTKFDSHTGWPSFWQPLQGAVSERDDRSIGMSRTEVKCANCGGHLGHVFDDGPKPTGLRYCMNGVAMKFEPGSA